MEFNEWLQQELDKRGWDQPDILKQSKLAGYPISQAQLWRIMAGEREAGVEACISLAYALKLPREEVFRARGWLLREPENIVQPSTEPVVAHVARRLQALPEGMREKTAEAFVGFLNVVEENMKPRHNSPEALAEELLEEAKRLDPELMARLERELNEERQQKGEAADTSLPAPDRGRKAS